MNTIKPKRALTIILLSIFDFIMILWVCDWKLSLLAFVALSNIVLAFKEINKKWITKGLILFLLVGVNFVAILWAAQWTFTPIVFTAFSDLIIAAEKIHENGEDINI